MAVPQGRENKRQKKKAPFVDAFCRSCGSRTRTSDLWVMSPTSYQLLHPAMFFRGAKIVHLYTFCNTTIVKYCYFIYYISQVSVGLSFAATNHSK